MGCKEARNWIFQRLDGELDFRDLERLNLHLDGCPSCAREMNLLLLPRRLARVIPVLEPSPYFYQKLRARLQGESESVTIWQILLGLSRQIVPALAALTLVLISIFGYQQLRRPEVDVYQAYDSIFMSGDRPQRMVIADLGEITEESVLRAIAEEETVRVASPESNPSPKQ